MNSDIIAINFLLSMILIIIVFIITIIATIISLVDLKEKEIQNKVNNRCKNCNSERVSFLTVTKKIKTNVNSCIGFNIVYTAISITITLFLIGISLMITKNGYDFFEILMTNQQNFNNINIEESAHIVTLTLMSLKAIKYQFILLAINLILYVLFAYKKESIIVTVCSECGTITENLNDNEESKKEKIIKGIGITFLISFFMLIFILITTTGT